MINQLYKKLCFLINGVVQDLDDKPDPFHYFKNSKGERLTDHPALYDQFKKINTALKDKDKVRKWLCELNEELVQEIVTNKGDLDQLANLNCSNTMYRDGFCFAQGCKKILSTVLGKTEKACGFGTVSYAWGTSAESFLNNLRARRPFKDYNAALAHGEFAHRIQWWLICNKILSGATNCAELYAQCADWTVTTEVWQNKHGFTSQVIQKAYLWDFLCDHAVNTIGSSHSDGRNPLVITTFCREERPGVVNFLKIFVEYRHSKMQHLNSVAHSATWGGDATLVEFWNKTLYALGLESKMANRSCLERASQRLFNKPVEKCSLQECQTIVFIFENGFSDHDLE